MWMYSDEMFYLYCTSCNAGFCLSALSSIYVEEVSICLFCVTKISREEDWGETEDNDSQVLHLQCFYVHGEWRRDGTRALHTCWTLNTNTILSLFLPPSFFFSVWLSDHIKQWRLKLDSSSGIALRLMTLSRPPSAEWPVEGPTQTALESPTCLKCTQMQFDPSSGLWEAHLATLLFILFTIRSLKEKKRYLPSDVLYGFVPLWFQIVVWFVALKYFLFCLSQSPSVVWKTKDVFQKNAEAWTGREVYFLGSRRTALFIAM